MERTLPGLLSNHNLLPSQIHSNRLSKGVEAVTEWLKILGNSIPGHLAVKNLKIVKSYQDLYNWAKGLLVNYDTGMLLYDPENKWEFEHANLSKYQVDSITAVSGILALFKSKIYQIAELRD